MPFDLVAVERLAVAVLGGMAVGIERQWSGKADGPTARFAGVRTFTLLGLVAGLGGWFWTAGITGPAIVLLGGLSALIVVAYQAASRTDVDGTTEVAAFVVLAAGVLAGAGHERLASAIVAGTAFLLLEKKRLHTLVKALDRVELRAGARFAVMAAVILPILPEGPFGPFGGIRPRQLWALVLFFSGLSFVGYAARRVAGPERGFVIAGVAGGLLSSTSTTLTFARLSHTRPEIGAALAAGALGANVMLFPRVLLASAILSPDLARAIWPAFIAPAVIGVAAAALGIRGKAVVGKISEDVNPLQIGAAIQMAILFQIVLFAAAIANGRLSDQGVVGSAALLGLTDVDALTVAMAQLTTQGTPSAVAANALTVGILANTVIKLGISLVVGAGRFRALVATGLAIMAIALAASLWW